MGSEMCIRDSVNPEWTLLVDEAQVDSQKKTGEFTLTTVVDGKEILTEINQGNLGSVEIIVKIDGKLSQSFSGFLI